MINTLKERDAILEGILDTIQNDPVLNKELIVRGGGALHFFYSSPRYSGDIDVLCPGFEHIRKDIETRLMKKFEKEGKLYVPRIKKSEVDYLRVGYSEGFERALTGNLELDRHNLPQKCKASEGKYAPILVEEPCEIYSDKIIATLGRMTDRGSIKGSDLFDFNYISDVLKQVPADKEIEDKAQTYNYNGWNEQTFLEVIKFITENGRHDEIRACMRKSMSPDFYETQKFDAEYFEKSAEHFLRLLPLVRKERQIEIFPEE